MAFREDNLPIKKTDQFVEPTELGFKPLWNLVHQMDSFFNQFFTQMNSTLNSNFLSLDTYETESDVIFEVTLPERKSSQIHLEFVDNRLKIGMEDSLQEEANYPTHTGRRQFYSRKEYIISLPYSFPEQEAQTTIHNDVLRITVPKKEIRYRYL